MSSYAHANFKTKADEQILMKVSLSSVSMEGAYNNMRDLQGWDFDKAVKKAESLWNNELSRIQIETED